MLEDTNSLDGAHISQEGSTDFSNKLAPNDALEIF